MTEYLNTKLLEPIIPGNYGVMGKTFMVRTPSMKLHEIQLLEPIVPGNFGVKDKTFREPHLIHKILFGICSFGVQYLYWCIRSIEVNTLAEAWANILEIAEYMQLHN